MMGGIEKIEESQGWHRLRTIPSGWDSDEEEVKKATPPRDSNDLRSKLKVDEDAVCFKIIFLNRRNISLQIQALIGIHYVLCNHTYSINRTVLFLVKFIVDIIDYYLFL